MRNMVELQSLFAPNTVRNFMGQKYVPFFLAKAESFAKD